jgi:transcriptional regulator with XRE-family HTH domain
MYDAAMVKKRPLKALRAYRKRNGITLAELSKKLNVHLNTISRWEVHGTDDISVIMLVERKTGVTRAELRPDLFNV